MTERARSAGPSLARYDAVVIGSGPNGLAAAIALARAGLATLVVEAHDVPGGGARTQPLTRPGFVHDVCSAVHPLAVASPFFRTLDLDRHGLSWIHPPSPLAHVLSDGRAVVVERSVAATAQALGDDAPIYARLLGPLVERFDAIARGALAPLRIPPHPLGLARFGWLAIRSTTALVARFDGALAPALLAGVAAHGMLPLEAPGSAAFALLLTAAAHAVGWPIPRGGSQAVTDALVSCLRAHGGELVNGWNVDRLDALPPARAYVFDVGPAQVARIAGGALPDSYRQRLSRFRYGPGVCKVDWALRAPIPWRDPACRRAGTVHISGGLVDVAAAERAVHDGRTVERPFAILTQPSLFDPSRAPAGMHVAWAYCHVPHGAVADVSAKIEDHVELCAPGFKEIIVDRAVKSALDMERYNPNYVGGDINGGLSSLPQLFFRPVVRWDPYATAAPHIFLCSSSTPPGGGVHGMCGYWAARSVLSRVFHRRAAPLPAPR